MVIVNGTKGYSEVVDRFIDAADAVDFATLHRSYSALIPSQPARVLDVGAGTHVFPTDPQQTADLAASFGLTVQVRLVDQPSMIKGKENVNWAYLAFCKG